MIKVVNIKNNVVWCCWGCNIAKSNFTLEEFINNCNIISNNKNNIFNFIKSLYE